MNQESGGLKLSQEQVACLLAPFGETLKGTPLRLLEEVRLAARASLHKPVQQTPAQNRDYLKGLLRDLTKNIPLPDEVADSCLPYLDLEEQSGWIAAKRGGDLHDRLRMGIDLSDAEAGRGRSADPRLVSFVARLYDVFARFADTEPTNSTSTDNSELVSPFGKFVDLAVEMFSPHGQSYGPGQIRVAVARVRQFESDSEWASQEEAIEIIAGPSAPDAPPS